MCFLEEFYIKTVKYNLLNKFRYNESKKLPRIKKINLSFSHNNTNIKHLSSSILAIELITKQKGILIPTKKSNIMLKLKKNNPIGCKINLRKTNMFYLLMRLLIEIFPKTKVYYTLNNNKLVAENLFTGTKQSTAIFEELDKHYHLFHTLPKLNVTIMINSGITEQKFILKALKMPINDGNKRFHKKEIGG